MGKEGNFLENYPDYLGCCERLDYNLGRMINLLKEKGIYDDTIIIFTSDHGSHFRTRNNEYKRSCHESSIRIPMIIKGPGFKSGYVEKELVSLIDIPATILYGGTGTVPNDYEGIPLQKRSEEKRDFVFLQISESQVGRAIRTKRWKYSVVAEDKNGWLDSHSDTYVEEFLYDLENDPYESHNLVSDETYKSVRKELAILIQNQMEDIGEFRPTILPRSNV